MRACVCVCVCKQGHFKLTEQRQKRRYELKGSMYEDQSQNRPDLYVCYLQPFPVPHNAGAYKVTEYTRKAFLFVTWNSSVSWAPVV